MNQLPIDRLVELSFKVPAPIILDAKRRMSDWLLSGGKQDDPYMWQQVRFAENWLIFNGGISNE